MTWSEAYVTHIQQFNTEFFYLHTYVVALTIILLSIITHSVQWKDFSCFYGCCLKVEKLVMGSGRNTTIRHDKLMIRS